MSLPFRFPFFRTASRLSCAAVLVVALLPASTLVRPALAAPATAEAPLPGSPRSLLARAEAGDIAAAEELARRYEQGTGFAWDPPSALRWYAAAALGGSGPAGDRARSLWLSIKPLHRLRAQALLAKYFSDDALSRIGIGPVEREKLRHHPWTSHVRVAGTAGPDPEGEALTADSVPALRKGPPLPGFKPGSRGQERGEAAARSEAGHGPVSLVKPPRPATKRNSISR